MGVADELASVRHRVKRMRDKFGDQMWTIFCVFTWLAPSSCLFLAFFHDFWLQTTSKNVQKMHFSRRLRTPNLKKIAGARRERAAPRSGNFFKLGSPNAGARFRCSVSLCYSPSGGATRHASMKSLRTHVGFPLEVPFAVRSVCLSVCPSVCPSVAHF